MKKIHKPKQKRWLILILAFITISVTGISFLLIYQTSIRTITSALTDIAEGEKAKIKSFLNNSFTETQIIDILNQSYYDKSSIGETGEFVIATRSNDTIIFLLRQGSVSKPQNKILLLNSNEHIAEPLKKAFEGNSGNVKGIDYDGSRVFAGYTYIKELNWSIVAKIDVDEINKPFIRAGIIVLCVALLLIVAGSYLFDKITSPMINKIMQSENKFKTLISNIEDSIFILDLDGNIVDANDAASHVLGYTHDEFLKMTPDSFISDKNNLTFKKILTDVIKSGYLKIDMEFVSKNGNFLPVEMNTKIMKYFDNDKLLVIAHDITDRKINEMLIHAEKERLAVTIHSIGDAVITTDIDGRITMMNTIAENLTGWQLNEALNKSLTDVFCIINNRTRVICENPVEKVLKTGEIIGLANHTAIISKHGIERIIADSGAPIKDLSGNIIGVVLVFRDVTDKEEIEHKLREDEERFRTIFEKGPYGMVMVNEQFRFINVNEAFIKLTGYERTELIKLTFKEITHQDHLVMDVHNIKKLYNGEIPVYQTEKRYVRKDGSIIWGSLYIVSIYDNDGKFMYFLGMIQDITSRRYAETELKNSERQLSTLMSNLPGMAYRRKNNTNWSMEFVSDGCYNLTDYRWEELVNDVKLSFSDLILPAFREELWNTVQTALINKDSFELNYQIKTSNGIIKWVWERGRGVFSDNNELLFIEGFIWDITERVEAEEEIMRARDKAEEADYLKSAFLANMSHEIRTPMNAILGFSQLLDSSDLEEQEKKEYIHFITKRGHDLLFIINDILDISKIEANQISIHFSKGNVNKLLNDVYTDFSSSDEFENKKTIELRIGSKLNNPNITTDFDMLRQILNNLISNALKFTENGFIEFGCSIDSNNNILFYCQDTGIGIPEDKQALIFERFRQVEERLLSRKFGGTGLGLSISKGLVELMGGEIWVKSVENQGATFFFTLPYEQTEIRPKPEIISKEKKYNWFDKLVLIIEDDIFNIKLLFRTLSDTKANYLHAADGASAIEIFRSSPEIDLVLLDIRLPDINGYEVAREILQINPRVKIIAQTAYASEEDKRKCLANGCCDFISKPIQKNDLLGLMNKYLS